MIRPQTIELDGARIAFAPGETILAVAERHGIRIPTLCHDSRLEPAGCCRICLVQIEGRPRLEPSCAVHAEDGMKIITRNERIDRHRKALLALYLSDHPAESIPDNGTANQLLAMAKEYAAPTDWPSMEPIRKGREDRNPYIHFDESKCIACARCTRYCEEVEGVSAITLAGRGPDTTIATADNISLMDSTCEMCGGCIDVCPTGAMTEKMPLELKTTFAGELEKTRTTCNYCGVGCQMDLNVDPDGNDGRGKVVKVTSPPTGITTNDGNLCVKGRFAYDFIDHPDRLTAPLVRDDRGELREATWDEALERAAQGLLGVRDRHGAEALGFISSSRCTIEENYLVQKTARAVFNINNVHQCAAT